jgi:hypothetical protein
MSVLLTIIFGEKRRPHCGEIILPMRFFGKQSAVLFVVRHLSAERILSGGK